MNHSLRELAEAVIRLRKEQDQAEAEVKAQATRRMARPTAPGREARSVPSSPAERQAEETRMRLQTAEMQYRDSDGTDQYLQELADEEEGDGCTNHIGVLQRGYHPVSRGFSLTEGSSRAGVNEPYTRRLLLAGSRRPACRAESA
jgi:hypothetical protein